MTEDLDGYDPFFDGGGAGFMSADLMALADDGRGADEVEDARSYLLTGGRTGGGKAGVSMESVVVMDRSATHSVTPHPEMDAIVQQCVRPLSVAEVAAHLHLPLGVVRVLVGDLVADGRLLMSETARDRPMDQDVDFLEHLIARVTAL